MKPIAASLWSALALLITAPLLFLVELHTAGRTTAVPQMLPLIAIAVVMWLTAVAEAFIVARIDAKKVPLQLKVMMLCKVFRFLIAALMLIAYGILGKGDIRLFAINLVVCYIVATAILTIAHTRRRNRQEKEEIKEP